MPLPYAYYGIGAAGNTAPGALTAMEIDGRVANLSVSAGDLGTVSADWAHDIDNEEEQYTQSIHINGEAVAITTAVDGFDGGPFAASTDIDLQVVILRPGEDPPFIAGITQDNRIIVSWTRGTETDLASHRIYWDAGAGGSFSTLLDTVDEIVVEQTTLATVTSGTGSGRVSIEGEYDDEDPINDTWSVKITGSGTFDYDAGSGFTGTDYEFFQNEEFNLPNGLRVVFHDTVASYDTNDQWDFRIGPREYFITDPLDDDTYQFKIVALDQAGNLSSSPPFASPDVSVSVDNPPDPVTAAVVAWDSGASEITLTWTDGADTASVNVYSNFEDTFDELRSYVVEHAPLANVAAATETYTLTVPSGVRGTFYFYLRAVDSGGTEETNASLLSVSALDTTYNDLTPPYDLTGVQASAGRATITWKHHEGEGAPSSFNLYEFTSEPSSQADFDLVTPTSVAYAANSNSIVTTHSATTSALGGQRWFSVRAVDGSGNETDNLDSVTVSPDSSAPADPTSIAGSVT